MTTTTPTIEPTRAERRVATFAILSLWLCSFLGQAFALWWGRRHGSLYVRRWAWLSLSMIGLYFAGAIVVLPFLALPDEWAIIGLPAYLALWLGDLFLYLATIPLAVRAWKGHDAASRWIPAPLARRLPQGPNPH